MKVYTKPVQRAISRVSVTSVLFVVVFVAMVVFLTRSCVEIPEVVSAVTGREENEGPSSRLSPLDVHLDDDAAVPVLKPWQHAEPAVAHDADDDTPVVDDDDDTPVVDDDTPVADDGTPVVDDVVLQAEKARQRKEKVQSVREDSEAEAVIKEEEEEEDRKEDASAGEDRSSDDDALRSAVEDSEEEEKDADAKCVDYIFYDKPIKTGSTAVTYALREYIQSRGGLHRRCSYDACTPRADAVCDGSGKKEHLIGHIRGRDGLVECMKDQGYYALTSVRDPLERWKSAFLFNRMMKGTHYGIPYQESFSTFMDRYPDCTLFHYYDRMGSVCKKGKLPWKERMKKIVKRYDEVIDLYAADSSKGGRLYRKISKYISQENVSKKPRSDSYMEEFNSSRLEPEQTLYDSLVAKRAEGDSGRIPC